MENINRNNYEAWLMLYLDNELTAAEREAVEAFAANHPLVQEELNGLKETLLMPEQPGMMPGKERLLMPEPWNGEALTRQQEQLLLLADNELPAGDKASLEAEIDLDPLLKKEWELLRKTIPEAVQPDEMPGKQNLYRHEKVKVISLIRVVQWAAAAAVLGFGWFFLNRNEDRVMPAGGNTVAVKPKAESKIPGPSVNYKPEANAQNGQDGDAIGVEMLAKQDNEAGRPQKLLKPEVIRINPIQANPQQEMYPVVNQDLAANETPVNREITGKEPLVRFVDVGGIDEPGIPGLKQEPIDIALIQSAQVPISRQEIIDVDDLQDEDRSINIAGARISKQKIRGLYRGITRPIARTFERGGVERVDAK